MNINERQAAESLRKLGFASAFAFDDGVGLDSSDAKRLASAVEFFNFATKPTMKGIRKPQEDLDASSRINF